MIEVVVPTWSFLPLSRLKIEHITRHLEECGRVCYKSEDKITADSADKFVEKICRNRHESVLEHECLTVCIVCSRACSHQLVRHRLAAYSQESMRYCNYSKKGDLQVICPPSIGLPVGRYNGSGNWGPSMGKKKDSWIKAVDDAYQEYLREIENGVMPEDARFVLPNATKTEVVTTFNLRMWRHVFQERALNRHAQWEIRQLFGSMLHSFRQLLPAVFGDLT